MKRQQFNEQRLTEVGNLGIEAMREFFLLPRGSGSEAFERALERATLGKAACGMKIAYESAMNNRRALELAEARAIGPVNGKRPAALESAETRS